MSADRKLMNDLYKTYNLTKDDIFTHNKGHYKIITRSGIEKIQAEAGIEINYDVVGCARDFCIIKATGKLGNKTINTLASAVQGGKEKREVYGKEKRIDMGSTDSWYLAEIAEKRAMSRIVLKLLGLYAEGYFGEDEDVPEQKEQEDHSDYDIISNIQTVEELAEYRKANQGKGKEFNTLISKRKLELGQSTTANSELKSDSK